VSSKLLTAADVAERLQISRSAAYELIARLHPHVRIGKLLRLPESTLERFLAQEGDACRISSPGKTPPTSGAGGTTLAASAGRSRRGSTTSAQRRKLLELLSDDD
jgi:excisionase family DNA binding protein